MEVRFAPNEEACQRMTTDELRRAFVFEQLFATDEVKMTYMDIDRCIVGGAMPVTQSLKLLATKKELAADFFTERREVGIINVGGAGTIACDGSAFSMVAKDVLYIGRGVKEVNFASDQAETPAMFYFVSYPAHTAYPTRHAKFADAEPNKLGTTQDANKRTIYKYIHARGIQSCQLVMGMTELEEGSVWNSMPAHTHIRRSEVYMYFDLGSGSFVMHLMGKPDQTKNVLLRDRQAVISPSWSIHCGAGTKNYSFVWAMGGENQEFSDMDAVPMTDLR